MSNILQLSDYCAQSESTFYKRYRNKLTEKIGTNTVNTDTSNECETKRTNTNDNNRYYNYYNQYKNQINDAYTDTNTSPSMLSSLSSSLWAQTPAYIPYNDTYNPNQTPLTAASDSQPMNTNCLFSQFWNTYPITDNWFGSVNHNNINDNSYIPPANEYHTNYEPNRLPLQQPIGTRRTVGESNAAFSCLSQTDSTNGYDNGYDNMYIQPKIRRRMPSQMECVFCKNNDEPPELYKTHILKDPECRIVCPVLRAYDCPICHNGGGDKAHTVRYCPLNRAGIHMKMERISRLDQYMQTTDLSGSGGGSHSKRGRGGGRARAKFYVNSSR